MGWPGPMTHRQYQVWQKWLNLVNQAQEDAMHGRPTTAFMTQEEINRQAKSRWTGMLKAATRKVTRRGRRS